MSNMKSNNNPKRDYEEWGYGAASLLGIIVMSLIVAILIARWEAIYERLSI